MKQLVVASTFYQCLSLAAAVDAGVLPEASERILVLATSAQAPELSPALEDHRGFARIEARFDRVVDLAALLYPRRPVQFAPREIELITWQQLLRSHWDLGDGPVQILMDSVQVNPALALARIFNEADLFAHSDGLMTYAPTRKRLPRAIGQRMAGLVYVDLVPGLIPKLLVEEEVEHRIVPAAAVRRLITEIAGSRADDLDGDSRPGALILGQYLASLQLLSREQEVALHLQMITKAVALGAEVCTFKPHPSAPPAALREMNALANRLSVELVVDNDPEIAELAMCRNSPRWVLSCFSTGLATARFLLGIEAVAVGPGTLLDTLAPYENSNRMPLVLAEALFNQDGIATRGFMAPTECEATDPRVDLQRLVDTVAYCMQPTLLPETVGAAVSYLTDIRDDDEMLRTLLRRRRLTDLGLPGALPPAPPSVRLRRRVKRSLDRLSGAPSR